MTDLQFTIDEKPTFMDTFARWIPRIAVAILFFTVGVSKFDPHGSWVPLFDRIGFGQWFRIFTGVLQAGGAILLLISRVSWIGAAVLACTMLGAIVTEIFLLHVPLVAIIPAMLMGITAAVGAQARGWI